MLNGIAHRFHVSPDAVGRHRRHMRTAMLKAQAACEKQDLVYGPGDSRLCRTSPVGLWRGAPSPPAVGTQNSHFCGVPRA